MLLPKLSLLTTATNQPITGPKGPKDTNMIEVTLNITYQTTSFNKPNYTAINNIVNFKNAVSLEHLGFYKLGVTTADIERGSVTFKFSLDDVHLIPTRIEHAQRYLALFDCTIEL